MSLLARSARRLFAAPAAQSYKDKLLLTLGSPTDSLYNRTPVDSVQLPGAEGTFTVTNLHSMVVSQLKAGKISVWEEAGKEPKTFFVSDGFAFVHEPKTGEDAANAGEENCSTCEVSGVELVPTDAIDKEKAAALITELNAGAKDSEWDKAKIALGTNMLSEAIKATE